MQCAGEVLNNQENPQQIVPKKSIKCRYREGDVLDSNIILYFVAAHRPILLKLGDYVVRLNTRLLHIIHPVPKQTFLVQRSEKYFSNVFSTGLLGEAGGKVSEWARRRSEAGADRWVRCGNAIKILIFIFPSKQSGGKNNNLCCQLYHCCFSVYITLLFQLCKLILHKTYSSVLLRFPCRLLIFSVFSADTKQQFGSKTQRPLATTKQQLNSK